MPIRQDFKTVVVQDKAITESGVCHPGGDSQQNQQGGHPAPDVSLSLPHERIAVLTETKFLASGQKMTVMNFSTIYLVFAIKI
jgi:hypothetical protein